MNICVFGSSSEQIDKIYLESAEHLGKRLPKRATTLFSVREIRCYGRICPRRIQRRWPHNRSYTRFFIDVGVVFDKCSELIVTDTMRERKGIMEDKADAFVICAGGMGTFEEFLRFSH